LQNRSTVRGDIELPLADNTAEALQIYRAANQAFIISDPATRKLYEKAYDDSSALYYGSKPTFTQILERIGKSIDRL
jgi:hypothetical protein